LVNDIGGKADSQPLELNRGLALRYPPHFQLQAELPTLLVTASRRLSAQSGGIAIRMQ
jgi:hypothetical protein